MGLENAKKQKNAKTNTNAEIQTLRETTIQKIKDFKKGLVPILWPVILICGLILPADFSTAAILLIVCFTMMFVGGAKIKHLGSIIGAAFMGFLFLILIKH